MKRWKLSQRMFVAMVGLLAGAMVSGCGDSGTTKKFDASVKRDAKRDTPPLIEDVGTTSETGTPPSDTARLETQGPDLAGDRAPTTDARPADAPDGGAPALDATADDAADAPVAPIDAGADTGGVPHLDAPVDTAVVLLDGNVDVPPDLTLAPDTVDASAPDLTKLDTNEADAPVVPTQITGWPVGVHDFGQRNCGESDSDLHYDFTLTNASASAVTIESATFSTDVGYHQNASGKTIPANGTLVVTIEPPAIPLNSALPMNYADTLTITTNIPDDPPHLVQVTQAAKGAILQWDTTVTTNFGSFGSLPPDQSVTQTVRIVNTGTVNATVDLTTTSPFSVNLSDNVTINAGAVRDIEVTFTAPIASGNAAATLSMATANQNTVLCQPIPAALPLTGTAVNGAISVSTQSMVFTPECGETGSAETFTITNTGNAPLDWNATLSGLTNSIFNLDDNAGTIGTPSDAGVNQTAMVTVTPEKPDNAAITQEIITVTTNSTSPKITVTRIPLGANITLIPSSEIDFGSVPIVSPDAKSATRVLTVANNANAGSGTARVQLSKSGDSPSYFTITPSTLTIAAGAQATATVTFSPGTNTNIITSGNSRDLTANLNWAVNQDDANCGTASGTVSLKGRATRAMVAIQPSALDFGLVNCNAQAAPQQITISNPGSASFNITSLSPLTNADVYTLSAPDLPATVPAGGSVVLTVTPDGIPYPVDEVPNLDGYRGSLQIKTNAVNDSDHIISFTMGAKGVIIVNDPLDTSWTFAGPTAVGSVSKENHYVRNTGNASAEARLTVTSTAEDAAVFSLSPNPTVIAANSAEPSQAIKLMGLFQPNRAGEGWNTHGTLTITPSTNNVFCKPLPQAWTNATITLTGTSAP